MYGIMGAIRQSSVRLGSVGCVVRSGFATSKKKEKWVHGLSRYVAKSEAI